MDRLKSKIMCPIDAPSIRKALAVPHEFVQLSQEYKEEIIIQFFHESAIEIKEAFMKSCSKPDSEILSLSYPIDLDLFNEESQSCVTLACQFLGLDTNGYITEPLLSLLFVISTCPIEHKLLGQSFQSRSLKFDEFLAKNIRSQLVNFHDTRVF